MTKPNKSVKQAKHEAKKEAKKEVKREVRKLAKKGIVKAKRGKAMSKAMKGSGGYKVAGRGDYTTHSDSFLGSLAQLGMQGAGNLIGQLIGSGAYAGGGALGAPSNSIMGVGADGAPPKFVRRKPKSPDCVQLRKRECLGEVFGSGGQFKVVTVDINPLLEEFAPWGSDIAGNYEEWDPHGVVFEYESTSTNYSSSIALGDIIMATQYKIDEKPFTNVQEMLEYNTITKCNPSQSAFHGVECAQRTQPLKRYYVQIGETDDQKFKSIYARFNLGINTSAPTDTVIGRLWVTYDLDLAKPLLSNMQKVNGTLTYAQFSASNSSGVYSWLGNKSNASASKYIEKSDFNFVIKPYTGITPGFGTGTDEVNALKFVTPGRYCVQLDGNMISNANLIKDPTVPAFQTHVYFVDSTGVATLWDYTPGKGSDAITMLSFPTIVDIRNGDTTAVQQNERMLAFDILVHDVNIPEGHLIFLCEVNLTALPTSTCYLRAIGLKDDENLANYLTGYTLSDQSPYDPNLFSFSLIKGQAQLMKMKTQYSFHSAVVEKQNRLSEYGLRTKVDRLQQKLARLEKLEHKEEDQTEKLRRKNDAIIDYLKQKASGDDLPFKNFSFLTKDQEEAYDQQRSLRNSADYYLDRFQHNSSKNKFYRQLNKNPEMKEQFINKIADVIQEAESSDKIDKILDGSAKLKISTISVPDSKDPEKLASEFKEANPTGVVFTYTPASPTSDDESSDSETEEHEIAEEALYENQVLKNYLTKMLSDTLDETDRRIIKGLLKK